MFSTLANRLTLARILVIPIITLFLDIPAAWAAWTSLALFAFAGLTDYLDGYLARRQKQISMIGQMLDPIADKLLVAAVILMLVHTGQIQGTTVFPAVVILLREVAVSGLREFLAGLQVSMPVSQLAKWKTTLQMLALGFLIVGDYAPKFIPATLIGDIGLWLAATLTAFTAWDYWRASLRHFKN